MWKCFTIFDSENTRENSWFRKGYLRVQVEGCPDVSDWGFYVCIIIECLNRLIENTIIQWLATMARGFVVTSPFLIWNSLVDGEDNELLFVDQRNSECSSSLSCVDHVSSHERSWFSSYCIKFFINIIELLFSESVFY